ncbi:MAG: glycosyltransferase family 2 protein [Lachnospiraceae bacterium]|nr:glycosyltransferase family 2 protein [Lachnospiraceae bacterium]
MSDILYMVLPCYNEEEVLPETSRQLKEKYQTLISSGKISSKSRIVFVNDGSKDKTWSIIQELHEKDPMFSGVNLSRNRGHQNALLAGLMEAKNCADMVISMDADLQDDIGVIDAMVDEYYKGHDVVYGARSARDKDTWFKRTTAESFYKLTNAMGGEVVFNHADCRLMSKRALEGLAMYKEVNLFLRGIVPMIGYPSTIVTYERNERFAGESKYPLKKMLAFAMEGITSLSTKPIRYVTTGGVLFCFIAFAMMIYSLVTYLTGNATSSGWSSLIISLWFVGGVQMIALGVIGEYVGKIYMEAKERPRFIVERFLNDTEYDAK